MANDAKTYLASPIRTACTVRWVSTVEESPAPGRKNWLLPTKTRRSSSIAVKESAMAAKATAKEEVLLVVKVAAEEEVLLMAVAMLDMRASPTTDV